MLIRIIFHKTLLKYTNTKEVRIDCSDLQSISYAIYNMFPSLVNDYLSPYNKNNVLLLVDGNKQLIQDKHILKNKITADVYYVVPSISGSGSGKAGIILGAAIAAFAFYALPAIAGVSNFSALAASNTTLGFLGKSLLGIGLNMILGGILALINKPPKTPKETDLDSRRDNDAFGSLTNTTDTSQVVALHYGEIRVAGQLISGYVKTLDHGKEDIIHVADQFSL